MHPFRQMIVILAVLAAGDTWAEDALPNNIAPLPTTQQERITPIHTATTDDAPVMSTQPAAAGEKKSPFVAPPMALTASPAAPSNNAMPQKIPFGRAEPSGPVIPSGPHKAEAVPVVSVDAVEASEPAPPTPVAPEADPAQEDPAEPTELTSPIFGEEEGAVTPRRIVLRALNKVTAQSELMSVKPNEMVKFGQLEITAITCRTSSPQSQTDYAGFLDISEKVPTKQGIKPLFRGWMYASSPSITALEHPVYDVTMVECKTAVPNPAKDEKADAKEDKKPSKKAKN
jgi:hypothetical protein